MTRRPSIRVRVKPEGERAFTTSLRRFLRDNRGSFTISTVKKIRRIKRGQEACFGGGAAPAFCVTRPGTASRLGGYSKRNRKVRRVRRGMKRRR